MASNDDREKQDDSTPTTETDRRLSSASRIQAALAAQETAQLPLPSQDQQFQSQDLDGNGSHHLSASQDEDIPTRLRSPHEAHEPAAPRLMDVATASEGSTIRLLAEAAGMMDSSLHQVSPEFLSASHFDSSGPHAPQRPPANVKHWYFHEQPQHSSECSSASTQPSPASRCQITLREMKAYLAADLPLLDPADYQDTGNADEDTRLRHNKELMAKMCHRSTHGIHKMMAAGINSELEAIPDRWERKIRNSPYELDRKIAQLASELKQLIHRKWAAPHFRAKIGEYVTNNIVKETRRKLDETSDLYENRVEQLNELATKVHENQKLQEQIDDLVQKYDDLQQKYADTQQEAANAQQEAADARKDAEGTRGIVLRLGEKLIWATEKLAKFEDEIENLKDQGLSNRVEDLDQDVDDAHDRLDELRARMDDYEDRLPRSSRRRHRGRS